MPPNPLSHEDFFNVRKSFTLQQLFDARVHLGHKSIVRDVHMRPFLFGCRLGSDIIDLEKTSELLSDALNFTACMAYRGGVILFVTRTPQNILPVEQAAAEIGEFSHCRRWRAGTLTNSSVVFGTTTRLPDLIIFFNTIDQGFAQHPCVVEAAKMTIPTIGVVDSNSDPRLITYPVPGNDDSSSSLKLYIQLFSNAILKGKEKRQMENTEAPSDNNITEKEPE